LANGLTSLGDLLSLNSVFMASILLPILSFVFIFIFLYRKSPTMSVLSLIVILFSFCIYLTNIQDTLSNIIITVVFAIIGWFLKRILEEKMVVNQKPRQPTVQELINSMVKILCAYHLLLEGQQHAKEFNESNIPEVLRGLVGMAYAIPIGTLIESDPLLSQCRKEVYGVLVKMTSAVSTTKSKDGEEE